MPANRGGRELIRISTTILPTMIFPTAKTEGGKDYIPLTNPTIIPITVVAGEMNLALATLIIPTVILTAEKSERGVSLLLTTTVTTIPGTTTPLQEATCLEPNALRQRGAGGGK